MLKRTIYLALITLTFFSIMPGVRGSLVYEPERIEPMAAHLTG